ncbi:MAG: RagB/SusD family nutrient uptake outer membrane protein [Bacteroidales bacterium]|nr:RagB/SusD family nutrient uptake outer membrane protein [Bacteroidales bacterium]MCF8390442.1 RagB/SusD family nutrient uptake outer membrane protein [Bacteroidales bacterium]
MNKQKYFSLLAIIAFIACSGCEDYLERSPEAGASEKDVFSTYNDFQGFIDPLYDDVIDYNRDFNGLTLDWGGECLYVWERHATTKAIAGDYRFLVQGGTDYSPFNNREGNGVWNSAWPGIRICNIALQNLQFLTDASQEEKELIKGQALFFRAYYHWEVIRSFGPMPYIDEVLTGASTDEFRQKRYIEYKDREGWQADALKIAEDFEAAAALLPTDWDETGPGRLRLATNWGRATKGAALALASKVLLYGASPLMSDYSGKGPEVDVELMAQAADLAWKVLEMSYSEGGNVYGLTPWADYLTMFQRDDGSAPYTEEIIFYKPRSYNDDIFTSSNAIIGNYAFRKRLARAFVPDVTIFGGQGQTSGFNEGVTQNYVDLFEMADGTRYKEEYDNDNLRRWDDRDPRFRKSIYVDRDMGGIAPITELHLYDGGRTKRDRSNCPTSYIVHKYWPLGINEADGKYDGCNFSTPQMRLAEVYLIYAEAVNEAYGPGGSAPGGITAVDAVNRVRTRAGMPSITAAATGYENFRELVQNERAVELCFESNYWFDTRRWYTAHTLSKDLLDLSFDVDHTSFQRVSVQTRVFVKPNHYWMPLPQDETFIYKDMYQNPGW